MVCAPFVQLPILAGCFRNQNGHAVPGDFRIDRADDINGIDDGSPAPAAAMITEIAARRALVELQQNPGGFGTGILTGNVAAHLAGNVRIQDDHLVSGLDEQRRKQSHGGTSAPDPHFCASFTVDNWRATDPDHQPGTIFDFQLYRFAIGDFCHRPGYNESIFAGQAVDPADMQHFRTILFGFDHTDFALADVNPVAFPTKGNIGIDFDDNRAIA